MVAQDAALPEEDEDGKKKKRRDHAFDVFRVSNQTFETQPFNNMPRARIELATLGFLHSSV